MIEETKNIECTIIYPLKFFLGVVTFMLIGTFSTIGISRWLDTPIIGIIGFVVFFITPAFYNKPIKNYFIKKAIFKFQKDDILVNILNMETDDLEEALNYRYQDIRTCTLNPKENEYSTIILSFQTGKRNRFTFIDHDDTNSSEVIYDKIIKYSSGAPQAKIELLPSFYSSKKGKRMVTAIIIGLVIFTVLVFYLNKR